MVTRFISTPRVEVTAGEDTLHVTADYFIVNTGAVSVIPPIEGIHESSVLTSTELQAHPAPQTPGHYRWRPIGVEFAGIFSSYGTG